MEYKPPKKPIKVGRRQVGWGFWLQWVLAGAVSGAVVMGALQVVISDAVVVYGPVYVALFGAVVGAPFGAVFGASVGAAVRLLRQPVPEECDPTNGAGGST